MLEVIKTALRIKHNELNEDIQRNVDACYFDLKRVGVNEVLQDPLIVKSVELYCKWQYNYENNAERYRIAYENLRDALSLSGDYNV